uniref:Uncharacterized protein n=1 Tax=Tetranychus urticae TaxID=32264 RepID=T1JYF2_TETUR
MASMPFAVPKHGEKRKRKCECKTHPYALAQKYIARLKKKHPEPNFSRVNSLKFHRLLDIVVEKYGFPRCDCFHTDWFYLD